jgi:hypothetical protein
MIVSIASFLLLICFLVQLIIDSSYENVLSSIICFSSGIAGLYLSSKLMRGPSLSSIALVGFQASYFWLPLISLTLDTRALSYNLSLPVDSFTASSVALFVLIGAYCLSLSISQTKSFFHSSLKINSLIKNNIRLSKHSFYTIITLALFARVFTTGLRLFGRLDTVTKIIEPVSIFAALSLACLFITPATPFIRKFKFNSYPGLVFLLTIVFTLPSLSRGTILITIANTLILLATKLFYPTDSLVARRKYSKYLINFALAALLIFPILDRISDATAYVRFSYVTRSGGPIDTAQRVLSSAIAGDRHEWIRTYQGPYPWDDTYTKSTIFSRFISVNYLDLSLRFHKLQDREARSLVQDFEVNRIISLLPDPLINIFALNYDKRPYTLSSFGDYNYYVISGVGLSGFRTGSLLVSLMALFGIFWPLALFIASLCVMIFFNLISYPLLRTSFMTHNINAGPITVCLMYEALTVFTSAAAGSESVSRLIELMFRTVPVMAIYFSFFARSSPSSIQSS